MQEWKACKDVGGDPQEIIKDWYVQNNVSLV